MRRLFSSLALFVLIASSFPAAAFAHPKPGPAPADEYFGPYHVSILEIRNRLTRLEGKTDRDMMDPGMQTEIDNVAAAVMDWQAHYPNDSWLPRTYSRLMRCYRRAGATMTARAQEAREAMRNAFPALGDDGDGDNGWARFDSSRPDGNGGN